MLLGVPKEDKKHLLAGKSKEGLLDKIINKEFNINMIVLDSLGSIIPPGEDTSAVGKMNISLLARFLTTTFRKLSLEVNKAQIPFVVINHKKANMDPYGVDHTFSGGNTYAHFLSANIYFEVVNRADAQVLNEKDQKIGHTMRATIEKSKFGPYPRKCEFKVDFGIGIIDKHMEIANLALDYEVVKKQGENSKTYEYGEQKWVGMGKLTDSIGADEKLANELIQKISEARDAKLEQKRLDQKARTKKLEVVSDIMQEEVEETKKKAKTNVK